MRISVCASVVVLLTGTLLPVDATSQNRRLVIVSPRVGGVIDALEATTYKLFPTIKNFHSASIYQAPDSSLSVMAQLKSAEAVLRDSTFAISFELVNEYAERIDHWGELLQGSYRMGTSQPQILCDDGTPLNPPPVASMKSVIFSGNQPTVALPRRFPADALPLAPDTSGLVRPRFATIRFDVALGLMLSDFSELKQLTGSATNISVPLSFYVQVPIAEDPSIVIISGWGFALGGAGGGSEASFSTFLLYRPGSSSSLKPIVGLGFGYTSYEYGTDGFLGPGMISIHASESYPLLIFGLNIVPNTLDILLTCPLTKGLNTTFESNSYTIRPAGFGLSLLHSL